MTVFVALLRAVNVGGTGTLPMKELQALCAGIGLVNVRTYIQSGNVVFESGLGEQALCSRLARALHDRMGKAVNVMVRSAAELRATLDANPFPQAKPARIGVVFLSEPAGPTVLAGLSGPDGEVLHARQREVFIHYPVGMGRSKLKLPATVLNGTMRNLNTVARLVAMAEAQ